MIIPAVFSHSVPSFLELIPRQSGICYQSSSLMLKAVFPFGKSRLPNKKSEAYVFPVR